MRKFFEKFKKYLMAGVATAGTVMATAAPAQAVTFKDNLQAENIVGSVLDYLLLAGQLVGGGILIYALISFALSIAQENPDQRSRAIMFIVAGAFLVSIKAILSALGVIN